MTPTSRSDPGGRAGARAVVSTDPGRGDYAPDDPSEDATVVQRAYDEAVAGSTGGTLVLDPADRPFEFDAPLDVWQSGCRVTATGGPTIVPAEGYAGPLLTSGLRPETETGEDGLVSHVVLDAVWLDGHDRATGVKLSQLQLSTVSRLHVRNTDGPGLWLADGCIENLFSDLVLSDFCGSEDRPALLLAPESERMSDERIEGPVGNITVNSTHFSGTTVHFPTNEALRVSAGPAPVSKGRRHRKFQFTGCMFHGHGDADGPVATVADTRQAAFVGTQWLLWQDDGVVVRLGSEDARWPTATTTFSHCRFSSKPDSTATGVRCENVEAEVPCLQVVASTFERMAHAVDWGGQRDKRASWAGNGVDTTGDAHVGVPPADADVSPF